MITIKIDDAALRKALAKAPQALAVEVSKATGIWLKQGLTEFQQRNLRAPDDRNQSDFLLRRPRTSKGLRRATGKLAEGLVAQAPIVQDIKDLRSTVGFITGGLPARIARVHELGTIKYGGKLPDIVPRRAKYLAIPIRSGASSRGTKVLSVVKVKKVGIPPRLGFVKFFTDTKRLAVLRKWLGVAAQRALGVATKRA